ncbi:DUF2510 domain-containing protein [Enemella sp. A6]|uniref:DUF2510 domain-containing protein n=1 Tax=Enemella sp. A6 TaxID=3440152 RepID=UPI003EBE0B92
MSSPAGWYPDPGGSSRLRYWDGHSWSAALSDTPDAPPPPTGFAPGQVADPVEYAQTYGTGEYGSTDNRKPLMWGIIGVVALVVIAMVAFLAIRSFIGGGNDDPTSPNPRRTNTTEICPPGDPSNSAAPPQKGDGWVRAGKLAYKDPQGEWSAPRAETRVPFSRAALSQNVTIHKDYQPGYNWVASITLGELLAGDGFYSPKDGAEVVVKCVVGSFYGEGTEVHREDVRSEAITVDGRDAWVIESNLSFDIPNLEADEELLIVVIVDTGDAGAGLFYASIPNTSKHLEAPAREAMASLKVG